MLLSALRRSLVTPAQLVRKLDWQHKTSRVLALSIGTNKIDVVAAAHPSYNEIEQLDPIALKTRVNLGGNVKQLSRSTLTDLRDAVQDFDVCGLLVAWPVQPEGWCGAACGRTLFVLDRWFQQQPPRPAATAKHAQLAVALWDGHHFPERKDDWGRNAVYGEQPERKELHVASRDQYQPKHVCSAAVVWNDFCRHHWPQYNNNNIMYQQDQVDMHRKILGGAPSLFEDKDTTLYRSSQQYGYASS